AVMMSGARNFDNFFSTSSRPRASRSNRSSNKSGGFRIRIAESKSANDMITPTRRGRRRSGLRAVIPGFCARYTAEGTQYNINICGGARNRFGSVSSLWRASRDHPLDIFGKNVELEVHHLAGFGMVKVGVTFRMRDDTDGETVGRKLGDSQADAINSNRSIVIVITCNLSG